MDVHPDQQDAVEVLLAEVEEQEQELRAKLNKVEHDKEVVQSFLSFRDKGWHFHILDLVNREHSLFTRLRLERHPAIEVIDEVHRNAKQQADAIIRRYPRFLGEACTNVGLTLDPESRHPKYSLQQGFFHLMVDERKHVFKLLDNEGTLAQQPADVGAIAEVILSEQKRVFGRCFDGQKFLKLLRSQYLALVKKNNQPDGTSVPIRQITRRLGKNVKGFRSDEFLIDLSRLIEQGPMDIDDCRLDLQQTKDTNQGMLLHGAAGRGYIGFIVFRRI